MRDEENMDELFTKVWKDESTRWKIIFIFINALFSTVYAFITQNIILTIIVIKIQQKVYYHFFNSITEG